MKSRISLFNKAFFKQNLRSQWVLLLGLITVAMVEPFALYCQYAYLLEQVRNYGMDVTKLIPRLRESVLAELGGMHGLMIFFLSVEAVLVAVVLFSYLFTPRNTNMIHTYPVSRRSLFGTQYVTGVLFLSVPLCLGAAVAELMCKSYGTVTGLYFHELYFLLGAAFLFYNFALCVVMVVGNGFMAVILYGILNFLYMGGKLLLSWVVNVTCFGLQGVVFDEHYLNVFTPAVYLAERSGPVATYENEGTVLFSFQNHKAILGYFFVALLFGGIAYALYEKKHLESAGDLITVLWLKPIFQWGTSVCTASAGVAVLSTVVWDGEWSFGAIFTGVLLIGAVTYFLLQMLMDKSLHVFRKKVMLGCLAYTLCVGALYVSMKADVFRISAYMPKESDIKEAFIEYYGWTMADDGEEINWLRSLHQSILDNRQDFGYRGDKAGILIHYTLNNGRSVERQYWIEEDPEDEFVQHVLDKVLEYQSQPEHVKEQLLGIDYENTKATHAAYYLFDEQTDSSEQIELDKKDCARLYEALMKDIDAGVYGKAYQRRNLEELEYLYNDFMEMEMKNPKGIVYPSTLRLRAIESVSEGDEDLKKNTASLNINNRCENMLTVLKEIAPKLYEEILSSKEAETW